MSTFLRFLGLAIAWAAVLAISCAMPLGDSVKVQGHVTLADGTPLAEVRIHYRWPEDAWLGEDEVFTDATGAYSLWLSKPWPHEAHNWRHILMTPSLAGYAFTPPELDTIASEGEQTHDFTAAPVDRPTTEWIVVWWTWTEK